MDILLTSRKRARPVKAPPTMGRMFVFPGRLIMLE